MISLKYNFLFIHIPKTAGNSIQNVIRTYSEDRIICANPHQDGFERFKVISEQFNTRKHSSMEEYREAMGEAIFQKLFKFTCVRNPWDRAVSHFFSPHKGRQSWNRDEFIIFLNNIPSVRKFIALDGRISHFSFNNIDYFIRFENLNGDFKKVCNHIGIPWEPLPHRNKSNKHHYTHYYDQELVELVRKKYLEEITYFGYDYNQDT